MFTLLLKQNEVVEEEEEEEEAGEEEVGFHHGLSRAETGRYSSIWTYIFRLFNQFNGVQYATVLIISLFLWLGQQVVAEDEEAKALVGTVDGCRLDSLVVDWTEV